MLKKLSVKQFLKVAITLVLVTAIAIILYCVTVISDLPLSINGPSVSEPTISKTSVFVDELEQGQTVSMRRLKTYYLWSESELPFGRWLEGLKESGAISIQNKKTIRIEESLKLTKVAKNTCPIVFCYGHKIAFPKIPGLLWKGLIGIEDYRYLDHQGIDLKSLARALWHDLKVMRLEQGGSTLTQQLVKNLYLTNERKFSRKIKEMIASFYLEWNYTKEEILAAYFNEVEWGSIQGIRIKGVYAASLMYFDKKPDSLSPYEVAILIGLLKGPYYYSPISRGERLRKRANIVFNKLKSLSLFPMGLSIWTDERWNNWLADIKKRNDDLDIRSMWEVTKHDRKDFDLYTLSYEQKKLINDLKKKYKGVDWAAKTSIWHITNTGTVEPLFKIYSKSERSLDRAFDEEKHQVGSLLKPVVYGLLVDMGLRLEDEVETKPISLKLKSGTWSPREAHAPDGKKITYKQALVTSMNSPVIRAVQSIGFKEFEKELLVYIPSLLVPLAQYPAQLLGSLELSINDLADLYSGFLLRSCTNGQYNSVVEALSDPKATTVRFRVGQNMGQMKFFGKTGTTNKGLSNWFIGFDGMHLFISWVGIEDTKTAPKDLRVYGSNTAFLLYRNFYESRGKHFNEMACRHE